MYVLAHSSALLKFSVVGLCNTAASNKQQVERKLHYVSSPAYSTLSTGSWNEPVDLQDSGDEYEPSGSSSSNDSEEDTDMNVDNSISDTVCDNQPNTINSTANANSAGCVADTINSTIDANSADDAVDAIGSTADANSTEGAVESRDKKKKL